MSNTRRATKEGPLRQERYCSSPEFQRGLLANLVAMRCELFDSQADRETIWFLQLLSHRDGLETVAQELIAIAERDGKLKRSRKLQRAEYEYQSFEEQLSDISEDDLYRERMPAHLAEMCLNPESNGSGFFKGFAETLCKYKAQWIERRRVETVVMALGEKVFETLDYALEARCMVLLDGLARTGKTYAAKAWCELHPGNARYVQVPCTNDEIGFFRAIAKRLGVSINLNSKAQELRNRIEEVLQRGQLMIVFDEAHYLWPNSSYREALPGRINWIMTALVNYGVPVALVTTPQFIASQKMIERRSSWTSEQFIGRIGHYEKLPDDLSESDLEAVAKALLPEGDAKSIETLATYAKLSAKYLAGIDAAVRRARFLAKRDGRAAVTRADVKRAITESVMPSDSALAAALQGAEGSRRSTKRTPVTPGKPDKVPAESSRNQRAEFQVEKHLRVTELLGAIETDQGRSLVPS